MSNRLPRLTARRLPALGAALVLLALVLAGCVRIDTDLSIEGDTVSGTLITALDQAAAQQLELDPDDVFAAPAGDLTTLDGVTDAPYDDGTWAGTEYTFDQVLLEDLNQLADQDPEGLRIVRNAGAGTYEMSMVMDLAWLADVDDEELGEELDPDAPNLTELLERFEVTVVVTFPDEVIEHNGELTGTTVTWQPPPGERSELRAVSLDPDPPPGGGGPADPPAGGDDPAGEDRSGDDPAAGTGSDGSDPLPVVLLVGLAVLVLAAAGLGVSWLVRSRQPATAPLSEALAGFPPPAGPTPGAETEAEPDTAPDTAPEPETAAAPEAETAPEAGAETAAAPEPEAEPEAEPPPDRKDGH